MTARNEIRSYFDDVRRTAQGRWQQILVALGISAEHLRDRHGPCPGCGGKDRFRFDDHDGRGSFVCGQGGDTLAGDGFALVMHVDRSDFREAVQRVGDVIGIAARGQALGFAGSAVVRLEDCERTEVALREHAAAKASSVGLAQAKAASIWQASSGCTNHPYLARKGVQAYGTRLYRGLLVIPLRNAAGVLQSLEFISPDGGKKFLRGGRVKGSYFPIGKPGNVVCVAEGFATAASIFEATGHATACAFAVGNLQPVAEAIRTKFPAARIVLCADDDRHTPGNPGLTKARQAALAVGGLLAVPRLEGDSA